ncbi:MAG: pyrroloquinoline quinone-dependent dehydrogenase [Pseudomonadota bacterium]
MIQTILFYAAIVAAMVVAGSWDHLATAGDAPADTDWHHFGNDIGGSQYSPLDTINRGTVSNLEVAWTHRSGDYNDLPFGKGGTRLLVTPIKAGDTLYFCTPYHRVLAVNARTGQEIWSFDPYAPQASTGQALDNAEMQPFHCRGVSYWQDAQKADAQTTCSSRIFVSSRTARVYALDALTGQTCQDFGAAAGHPGFVSHHDFENFGAPVVGMSSPPLVINDLVVTGMGAYDALPNAVDGIVRAFDARTGARVWSFNPIPEPMRNITGAANVWTPMSADVERGLIFVPTSSPSPDHFGGARTAPLPLTDATVALDAATGEVIWSYQTVRHDVYDYDLPGHALSVTIQKDGTRHDVAIQQTKMGWMFVLDRDTGENVWPVEEVAIPQSDIAGERTAATQPIPVLPERFAQTSLAREDLFGLTPFDRRACEKKFDSLRYDGVFTPASAGGSLLFPSALGGGNWGGAAYDPGSNQLIIKAGNLATYIKIFAIDDPDPQEPGAGFVTRKMPGTPYQVHGNWFLSPLGVPCTPPPWGTLTAIDMSSGKINWQIPVGQSKRYGLTVPESFGWGSPIVGGPLATAGGLVFMAGALDAKIRAFDVNTGEEVWERKLKVPATAVPMTYMAGGEQYIVVAVGGDSLGKTKTYDQIVAFKLKQ